jgi:hypothetical protein
MYQGCRAVHIQHRAVVLVSDRSYLFPKVHLPMMTSRQVVSVPSPLFVLVRAVG